MNMLLSFYICVCLNDLEAWSLILRENTDLFRNCALWRRKTEQISSEWRKLQNEELYCLQSSPNEREYYVLNM
jgi:hypothetical protein